MSANVKRGYRSGLRAAQAQETRRSIVEAASRLFVEHGYGATTVDAIADAAGVSRKTVFTAVGAKLEVLKEALDRAVAGDDRPIALQDRDAFRSLLGLHDPRTLLETWAHELVEIDKRVAPLFQALEVAAGMDSAARELVEQSRRQRLDGARRVVKRLAELDALNSGLRADEAADVAWLAGDPALYDRLVCERGWSTRRFEEWLARTLVRQLLGAGPAT
jgi:AcrR family transcriptional regulator